MADDEHLPPTKAGGHFGKDDDYRKKCEKACQGGYHGHRWDAHHILPATVFTQALGDDPTGAIAESLDTTDYDINKDYSMMGLPKLTAYILFYQRDDENKKKRARENTTTMRRWGTVKRYASDIDRKLANFTDPGNWPVHNPVSWGHTVYNKKVYAQLREEIFDELESKKLSNKHFKPENLKARIMGIKDAWLGNLKGRGALDGIPGKKGVKDNLLARHQSKNQKWWIPLCMVDVDEPAS